MPKILSNLDLGKNELQNVVIQKLNSAPSNPIEGQIYYNTLSKNLYRYNGSTWITYQAPLVAGTDYIAPPSSPSAGDVLTYNGSAWAADTPNKDIYYGVCSSSGSSQTQSVTISGITSLYDGLSIRVYFNNAFTYNGAAKLNLNNLGEKFIYYNGYDTQAGRYAWDADSIVDFVYDSSYEVWFIVNSTFASTNTYGIVKLTNSYASTSTLTAATPAAVKTAYDLANGKQDPLPSQTGQSGKFLTTDGSALSWATVNSGGTIASTTNVLKGDGSGNAVAATEASVSTLGIDNIPTANSTNLVTSGGVYAAIADTDYQAQIGVDYITTSTTWTGNSSPYTQTVTLSSYTVTANTKVDVQADATTLAALAIVGTTQLFISNNNGTLTLYAIGNKPTSALTLQVTCTEVTIA